MMDRRRFLRNAALLAAGIVAADQLALLEHLEPRRLLFPGWSPPAPKGIREQLADVIYNISPVETPLTSMKRLSGSTFYTWQTSLT